MTKNELRQKLRERRRRFVAEAGDLKALERDLAARVIAHLGAPSVVAAYLPVGSEVDPQPLLEAIAGLGIVTALPHVQSPASAMRFLLWSTGDPLIAGPYGLLQPDIAMPEVQPDLVLAPLVAFDRAMRRLGQGAAFYDRAFARLPGARRIGLAWSVQETDALPADPWDVPLHAVATEQEWIEPTL